MVKQRESKTKPWGTLEELLLASAVNRHGTTSWDSVAMELHNRCSQSPSSQDCRNKFYDLKRRFLSQRQSDDDSASLMPMLDELRKIRVEELRRDVQRRDVLIVSLEMKVKRLEEERDRSLEEGEAAPDLGERNLPPENRDSKTKTASGDDSDDRENRSLNESNSTSKKDDVGQNGVVEEKAITESTKKETGPLRAGAEPGREWSFNGAGGEPDGAGAGAGAPKRRRERERNWRKSSQAGGIGDSNDAWESASESKQEGKEGVSKQQISSDVQSSGSLSQRKRCRIRSGGGSSSGDEPEGDAVSPAKGRPSPVKSEPLLKFLEIIRSHRLGSAFERRLRSQESDGYKRLIRQHIDLRTIHSRVVKGAYADSLHRFFRDLLLLFNNAIVFFHRSSSENAAALKLRALVLKEMKDKLRKPQPQPQPIVAKSKAKQEPDSSSKPSTIVGCRKRDSVLLLSGVGGKKAEKNSRNIEEKPKVDHGNKATESSEIKIYEKGTWKKGLKERPRAAAAANSGGARSSSRTTTSKNNGEVKHEYGGNELSSHDGMEARVEKKERVTKKKQGAVSFLKRMKQNSPSEATDEDGDVSEDESINEEEEEEEKKRKVNKQQKEGRRERVTRSGGGGGGGGRGRRGVGRPPKKAEAVTVKRQQKEEVGGGNGKPRKRSRR